MHSVKSSVVKALKSTVAYPLGANCSRDTHTCLVEQPLHRFPIMYHCSRANACLVSTQPRGRTVFVHESKQSSIVCGGCVAEMATAVVFLPITCEHNAIFSPQRTGYMVSHVPPTYTEPLGHRSLPSPCAVMPGNVGQISHIKCPESKHRFIDLTGRHSSITHSPGKRCRNGRRESELCHTACSIPAPWQNSPSYTSPVSLYNTRPIPSGRPFSSRSPLA